MPRGERPVDGEIIFNKNKNKNMDRGDLIYDLMHGHCRLIPPRKVNVRKVNESNYELEDV